MARHALIMGGAAVVASLIATHATGAGDLALRGFVRDKTSMAPVPAATVSTSGARSRSDQLTDDQGFFRLLLPTTAPGGLVRIRIEKDGFQVYDRNVSASEELPVTVDLVPVPPSTKKPGPARSPTPSEASLLLAQLKSADSETRVAAITAVGDRGVVDPGTDKALVNALTDPDYNVRVAALDSVGKLKAQSGPILTRVTHLLHAPEEEVVSKAASVLELVGLTSASVNPELLSALQKDWGDFQGIRYAVVRTLLKRGEHRDRRLIAALIQTVLELGTVRTPPDDLSAPPMFIGGAHRPDLFEAFQRYPDMVASEVPNLVAKLGSTKSLTETRGLISLLSFSGAAGRKALIEYAAGLRGTGRARFAVLWISVERAARADVLAAFSPGVLTEVVGPWLEGPDDWNKLLWPDGDTAAVGPSRATMAAAALTTWDIEPRAKARTVLLAAVHSSDERARFVLDVLPSFPADVIHQILLAAVATLADCKTPDTSLSICKKPETQHSLIARLAQLGDLEMAHALEALAPESKLREDIHALARNAAAAIHARLNSGKTSPATSSLKDASVQ